MATGRRSGRARIRGSAGTRGGGPEGRGSGAMQAQCSAAGGPNDGAVAGRGSDPREQLGPLQGRSDGRGHSTLSVVSPEAQSSKRDGPRAS